jgi:hypothetical protein
LKDKHIVILAVTSSFLIGGFLLLLATASIFLGSISSLFGLRVTLVLLFAGSMVSVFAIAPVLIYSFLKKEKIKSDTAHHLRNGLQGIILTLDILSSENEITREDLDLIDETRDVCLAMNRNITKMIDATPFTILIKATRKNKKPAETKELETLKISPR